MRNRCRVRSYYVVGRATAGSTFGDGPPSWRRREPRFERGERRVPVLAFNRLICESSTSCIRDRRGTCWRTTHVCRGQPPRPRGLRPGDRCSPPDQSASALGDRRVDPSGLFCDHRPIVYDNLTDARRAQAGNMVPPAPGIVDDPISLCLRPPGRTANGDTAGRLEGRA